MGRKDSIFSFLHRKWMIPMQIYKDMAPRVRALTQEKIAELSAANLAHAMVRLLPAVSTEGAEFKTAAMPPVNVMGSRDMNASLIA
jgi:hypothetical protein